MRSSLRPAYYALPAGPWRDYVTLLHIPYTIWHLSYILLGAAAAPTLHLDRLAGLLLAFFLAVGLGAHALDEFHGRPLRTRITETHLLAVAAVGITAAVGIGIFASLTISFWAVPFVLFGGFIVLAYNLELLGGRFHSDVWFGVAWGAFPALVAYWANAERLDATAVLVATGCLVLSLAQRTLSRQARDLRRHAQGASGRIEYQDGSVQAVTLQYLLATPETALRLLGVSIALLALGLVLSRL